MSDRTREQDLKELYEARQEASNQQERDRIDEIRYNIMRQQEDEELVGEREELVQSVRNQDAKNVRRVSERIKVITYKKGIDRNG